MPGEKDDPDLEWRLNETLGMIMASYGSSVEHQTAVPICA